MTTTVFSDDFAGTSLDTTKWVASFPWGNGTDAASDEYQYYLPANVTVANGICSLTAQYVPAGFAETYYVAGVKTTTTFDYSSGIICSTGIDFLYGDITITAKVPAGDGLWPALWLPASFYGHPPEIDILEVRGSEPAIASQTYIWDYGPPRKQISTPYSTVDLSLAFHEYGLSVTPEAVVWSIDGTTTQSIATPAQAPVPVGPMYLVCNLAVGGADGAPRSNAIFPASLQIASVAVAAA